VSENSTGSRLGFGVSPQNCDSMPPVDFAATTSSKAETTGMGIVLHAGIVDDGVTGSYDL